MGEYVAFSRIGVPLKKKAFEVEGQEFAICRIKEVPNKYEFFLLDKNNSCITCRIVIFHWQNTFSLVLLLSNYQLKSFLR